LTYVNLSPLANVTAIGNGFLYSCTTLASVDLSSLVLVTSIGNGFLGYCYALTSVTVGDVNFSNITIGQSNALVGVTNLTTNKIYGKKANAFKTKINSVNNNVVSN
jgi:hypothetical protein